MPLIDENGDEFEPDWWNDPRMRIYRAWLSVFFNLGPLKRPVGWIWRKVADR